MRINAICNKVNPVKICRRAIQKHRENAHIERLNRIEENGKSIDECMQRLKEFYWPDGNVPAQSHESFVRDFDYYIYLNPTGTMEEISKNFGEAGKELCEGYKRIGILSGSSGYRTTAYGHKQMQTTIDLHMLSGK